MSTYYPTFRILSETGKAVEKQIQIMSGLYTDIRVDKFVIMPNHIHLIVSAENGAPRTSPPTMAANAVVPHFVSTLKRYTNRNVGYSMWQRSFHDHIIRNENDYRQIAEYVDNNPQSWTEDCFYIGNTDGNVTNDEPNLYA